jgi:hypothetical protein
MSDYKFSDIQRVSIWEGYRRKCQYCNQPISYSELNIDHIIPESLERGTSELAALLNDLNLPQDFDINSYLNLFPAHSMCNLRKADLIFSKESILFYLEIAKSRYGQVLEWEERLRKKRFSEKILIDISIALYSGKITHSQVGEILKSGGVQSDFRQIYYKPRFLNLDVDEYISTDKIDDILDAKVELGGGSVKSLTLTNNNNKTFEIMTCRELKAAVSAGYYPSTNFDIKMYAFFVPILGLIKAVSLAGVSDFTFVKDVGINDIGLLPVNIFPYLSRDEEEEVAKEVEAGRTIRDWVKCGRIFVRDITRYTIDLSEREGMGIRFWELLRADLNNDGFEELLVYGYSYATHGTLGFSRLYLLERKNDEARFSFSDFNAI